MIRSLLLALTLGVSALPAAAQDFRTRAPEDEVIYFVLPDRFENGDRANDRGGLTGDRMVHGYDPTAKGFYHGGDLKGLTARLPYIQSLGATAIWVGPIFKNKPVQGGPGQESAGYHGYWITDFTQVDPHLGTNADFKALVDAAHARGMKVYMDIIANHTADVIQYRECADKSACVYRSRADYPYAAKGKNKGFAGDAVQTPENFAKLTDPSFAYTPYVPSREKTAKVPAWLNDPIYYHNRGNTTFTNESSQMGDFVGLDDLMTENPRVVAGMIDIFGGWIDRFGIDGYRIDTARHVNPEFWGAFVPAMLDRARAKGIPNFHIFGEVAMSSLEAGGLAAWTKTGKFPAVLDFSFREGVLQTVAGKKGTDAFETVFDGDVLYAGGEAMTRQLPTFTGNHDNGRFAFYVRQALPQANDAEILSRVMLSNAMLLTLRGVPTIYSGDEQGFAGDGNDQDAREDMFASQVASYNDNKLVGTTATTAIANFTTTHPLYRQIANLAKLRTTTPALTRGRQVLRAREETPGLLAISRFDPASNAEVLLLFNTSTAPITRNVQVETASTGFRALAGRCGSVTAPGAIRVDLPALGYAVCAAETR